MRQRLWGVVCVLSVLVGCSKCGVDEQPTPDMSAGVDAGEDAGADVSVEVDVSLVIEVPYEVDDYPVVEGFGEGGPHQGEDGCLIWDPETAPRTMTDALTLQDEDGNEIQTGEGSVLPLAMCNEHTADIQVFDRSTPVPDLPELAHPPCDATDESGCPAVGTQPVLPPAYSPTAPVPPTPTRYTAPTSLVANMMATPGTGESFESGTLANWTVSGGFPSTPVFGNNISIKRLLPPGFAVRVATAPDGSRRVEYPIEEKIGGDYWEFSASANQQGNFWVGTADARASHLERPGATRSELSTGSLTSPQVTLAADYMSFWIGGSKDASQRVELQVLAPNVNEWPAIASSYQGIGTVEFPENWEQITLPSSNQLWAVVRTASPWVENDYMGRKVVWDIAEYRGLPARIRIVDEPRVPATEERCVASVCTTVERMAHVNVDGIEFLQNPPPGLQNLPASGLPSSIGQIVRPQPLWGFTESHSHATANLSFGGHMIWGDWGDELSDVYDCLHDLDPIIDNSGDVLRPGITNPRKAVTCTVRPEIVATIASATTGVCVTASALLHLIPFVGSLIAAAEIASCTALVASVTSVLSTPLMTGHFYHGALMPTSGAIQPGPILSAVAAALVPGELERVPGMVEEKDYDSPDGTHSGRGLGQFHNHYQKDMIRRAYDGGLRLMVIDVHNSRAMQAVLDGVSDYTDWRAIEDHVRSVKRLVAGPGDPKWPVGDLNDVAEIAYTPAQARDLVRRNKLAIILGVEVMELGKSRSPGDTMVAQVERMYDLGIRKITPIHGTNNPLGGSGLFQDVYQAANLFNNLTINGDGRDIAVWEDLTDPVRVGLPEDFPEPFNNLTLGTWGVMSTMKAQNCPDGCPWEIQNGGYFSLTANPDPELVIGGVEEVNWRLGFPSIKHMEPFANLDAVESSYLGVNRAYSLGWLLGGGPGGVLPLQSCSLEGMYLPLKIAPPDDIEEAYDRFAPSGHFNSRTLTLLGTQFLSAMMERGIILDTDHFSQTTRVATLKHIESFAQQAAWAGTDYATMGVHTELRGFEFGGPYPELATGTDFHGHGGHESEISKTPTELARMAAAAGTITISMPGFFPETAPYAEGLVANDCDYSSKGYAQKYLKAMELMNGRGVTPGFDMNGFAPFVAPRYGNGFACRTGVSREALMIGGYDPAEILANQADDQWRRDNPPLAAWPRDWKDGGTACLYNGSRSTGWNFDCPSTQNLYAQQREFSAVLYDDYFGKTTFQPTWMGSLPSEYYALVARGRDEKRDDGAPREAVDEIVYLGGGGEFAQERPIFKWRNDGVAVNSASNTGWDYNLDGLRHIGLMPDMIQDMRNIGVTWELLGPMMRSAEDFISMWERNCTMARDWASLNGGDPGAVCAAPES